MLSCCFRLRVIVELKTYLGLKLAFKPDIRCIAWQSLRALQRLQHSLVSPLSCCRNGIGLQSVAYENRAHAQADTQRS